MSTKKNFLIEFLFLFVGLIFLIFCFHEENGLIDLKIDNIYFEINFRHVGIFTFLIHAGIAFVYFKIYKHRNSLLAIIHFILQTPAIAYFVLVIFVSMSVEGRPRMYFGDRSPYYFDKELHSYASFNNQWTFLILFSIAQLPFILNIVLYFYKKRKASLSLDKSDI